MMGFGHVKPFADVYLFHNFFSVAIIIMAIGINGEENGRYSPKRAEGMALERSVLREIGPRILASTNFLSIYLSVCGL